MSLCCRQNTSPAWLCLSSIWTSTGGSWSRKGLASGWPEFNSPRQQRNGGTPVAHHLMPPVASSGPPYGCPADSGWPTSYIFCRWWTTGGPSMAMSGKSHPPTAPCVPLVVHQWLFCRSKLLVDHRSDVVWGSTMSVRIVSIFLPPRTWRHNASYWLEGTPSQLRSTPLSRQSPERSCTSPPAPAIIQTHCPPSQYPSPCT